MWKVYLSSRGKKNNADKRKVGLMIMMVEDSDNLAITSLKSQPLSSHSLVWHLLRDKVLETSQGLALCQETRGSVAVKLTPRRRELNDGQDGRKAGTFWSHPQSETLPEALMIFVKLPAE